MYKSKYLDKQIVMELYFKNFIAKVNIFKTDMKSEIENKLLSKIR